MTTASVDRSSFAAPCSFGVSAAWRQVKGRSIVEDRGSIVARLPEPKCRTASGTDRPRQKPNLLVSHTNGRLYVQHRREVTQLDSSRFNGLLLATTRRRLDDCNYLHRHHNDSLLSRPRANYSITRTEIPTLTCSAVSDAARCCSGWKKKREKEKQSGGANKNWLSFPFYQSRPLIGLFVAGSVS